MYLNSSFPDTEKNARGGKHHLHSVFRYSSEPRLWESVNPNYTHSMCSRPLCYSCIICQHKEHIPNPLDTYPVLKPHVQYMQRTIGAASCCKPYASRCPSGKFRTERYHFSRQWELCDRMAEKFLNSL